MSPKTLFSNLRKHSKPGTMGSEAQQKLPEVTSDSRFETTQGIQGRGEYGRIRTIPRTGTQSSAHRPDSVSPKMPLLFPRWLQKDGSGSPAGQRSEFLSSHMGSPPNHPRSHSLSKQNTPPRLALGKRAWWHRRGGPGIPPSVQCSAPSRQAGLGWGATHTNRAWGRHTCGHGCLLGSARHLGAQSPGHASSTHPGL